MKNSKLIFLSGYELIVNLPLQMCLYFNAYFTPCWIISEFCSLNQKVNYSQMSHFLIKTTLNYWLRKLSILFSIDWLTDWSSLRNIQIFGRFFSIHINSNWDSTTLFGIHRKSFRKSLLPSINLHVDSSFLTQNY